MPEPQRLRSGLELRPSLWRYLQAYKAAVLVSTLIVVVLFLRGGGVGTLFAVLLAVGGSSVVSIYFRRARIVLTDTELISTGLIRTRATPRTDVAEVVNVAMPRSHPASRTFPHVFVLDAEGKRIVRLRGTHWLVDDMRRLIRELGVPPRTINGTTTPKDLARVLPAAVPFLERRPTVRNLLIVVPGLAAAAALVVTSSTG